MKVLYNVEEVQRDSNSVVTVGTYDGVHRAHQTILQEVVLRARRRQGRSVVVTFDPHPQEVLGKRPGVQLLLTLSERIDLLARSGIDLALVLHFTKAFSQLTSREFFEGIIIGKIGVSEVVVGYDHGFGKDRQGNIVLLQELGERYQFSVSSIPPFSLNGDAVSSTNVRRFLLEGDVAKAALLLGRAYTIDGTVVRGEGRGKRLGFPTANIVPRSEKKIIPKFGVYVVSADIQGRAYFGMMNIGLRPTFGNAAVPTLEVNIFDFAQDIYGEQITVRFLHRLRDEKKFSSPVELIEQIQKDRERSLEFLLHFSKE
jgi:riboflavin kinase/FMN adenylyltransferase